MNQIRCYFCNKTLKNETAEQHSAHCGYVLEPCVNKCGAYIQRHAKSNHLQVCRNARLKSARSTESLLSANEYDTYPRMHGNQTRDQNFVRIGTLPSSYRHQQSQTLQNSLYDYLSPPATPVRNNHNHTNPHVSKMASTPIAAVDEQQHSDLMRPIEVALLKLRTDVQVMQSQSKTLVEWRTNVQHQLDGIVNSITANNKNDVNTLRLRELSRDLLLLRDALNSQQVVLKTEQIDTRRFRNEWEAKFGDFERCTRSELQQLSASLTDQKTQIAAAAKGSDELRVENETLKTELANLGRDYSNMAQEGKLREAEIADLKRALAEINLNKEVVERSLENAQELVATQPGRLMWKLSDFKSKMENAKANEKIPLKSAVFYTCDYGYRVRLLVYLNGLKKWRGRHMLASLHVMKGDYDDLLKWPSRIEANIILRDLEHGDRTKDFVRYITAKRNYPEDVADDPQESSTQYIFIPHTTLLKANHLKHDAVFLEIIIDNSQGFP